TTPRAEVTAPAYPGRRVAARVARIGARVDAARGVVEVVVAPDEAAGSSGTTWLRPGQTVDVTVVVAERRERVLVPASALRRGADPDAGAAEVLVLTGAGRAEARRIRVGEVKGGQVVVLSGLAGGETLVRDAAAVTPGARVRPVARDGSGEAADAAL
ncbi:MAG TPA: hypothetical protein VM490_10335, partial [Armatimonadaceae bacterium]|nr:hypothetical protein [Armatimonadaceae bacterium]